MIEKGFVSERKDEILSNLPLKFESSSSSWSGVNSFSEFISGISALCSVSFCFLVSLFTRTDERPIENFFLPPPRPGATPSHHKPMEESFTKLIT